MNRLISLWNKNRKFFLGIIVIIIAIFVFIQLLNYIAKNELKKQNNDKNINTSSTSSNTIIDKSINTTQTESIISNKEINEKVATKNQELIRTFVDLCNKQNVEEAYSLISDECMESVFNTQDEFKSKYIDEIFANEKQYNIQNLYTSDLGTTYKITYMNDAITTGKLGTSIEDYLTVKDDKINLYRYIGKVKEYKTASNKTVEVTLTDREIYDEYEIYNIKATNLSEQTIMLNRNMDNKKIYATYKNGSNYSAILSYTYSGSLVLEKGQSKFISIKINKIYNGEYTARKITFSDIINNKEAFDKETNKNNYTDISSLEIDL